MQETKKFAHVGSPSTAKRNAKPVAAPGQIALRRARSGRLRTSAPSTRPAPTAMKNASSPYQNESVRLPVITAATTASTNVIGRSRAATVHRMRQLYARGRRRDDETRDVQRRRVRDRRDAAG